VAAESQRAEGVGKGTTDKEKRTWRRWCEYCSIIQNDHDIYLQELSSEFRTRLFGAFAAALRRRQFSRPDKNPLGAGTVEETVAKLGQIFRANVGYNPAHGSADNGMHPSLARQIKGMKNKDPGEKKQKALPVCVYREIYKQAMSPSADPQDITIAWLQVLAFFFCMRSCEYSETRGERKTKVVCFRNIRFHKHKKLIGQDSPELPTATSVSLTFEWQKRDVRDDTITHQRSNDNIGDKIMCPVWACIELINLIRSSHIPQEKIPDLKINSVARNGKISQISSTAVLQKIRSAVKSLGKDKLGFTADEVGTHSNRSGGAMGMYLTGTPVYTIMLMGRWSSDAFMRYIRKQVLDMSHGISSKMITYKEFYTIPDFVHNTADGDLRTHNKNNLATSSSFSGSYANMRRGTHPAFHLEH